MIGNEEVALGVAGSTLDHSSKVPCSHVKRARRKRFLRPADLSRPAAQDQLQAGQRLALPPNIHIYNIT